MCNTKDADNIKNLRLSKANLKSYLSKRYKSKIAETIVSCFTFSVNWDYNEYVQSLEVFVNNPEESLRKMIFHCFDFNGDNYVSEVDLFILMKTLDSDIFVNVVCKDVIDIVNFLRKKLKDKGLDDPIALRMKRIEKELIERKNKKFKQLMGIGIDTERSTDSNSANGIFQYSALNKIADLIEKKDRQVSVLSAQNVAGDALDQKKKESHAEPIDKKSKLVKMKDITYQICEDEEVTMKASLDEYLCHIKSQKLPALLIDIFIYLGARKYVEHVIEPGPNKLINVELKEITLKTSKYLHKKVMENDDALTNWRNMIGEPKVEEYWTAFRKFADLNLKSKPDNEIFVTMSSIMDNFEAVFGVKNEFMAR
jgi:hypothetical protein